MTFFLFAEWRNKLPSIKRLVTIGTFFEILFNIAVFFKPVDEVGAGCQAQAVVVEIGTSITALLTGFQALEAAIICLVMFRRQMGGGFMQRVIDALGKTVVGHAVSHRIFFRELIYYAICFVYIIVIFIMVFDKHAYGFNLSNGLQCWYKGSTAELLAYGIVWFGLSLDLVSVCYVSYEIGHRLIDNRSTIVASEVVSDDAVRHTLHSKVNDYNNRDSESSNINGDNGGNESKNSKEGEKNKSNKLLSKPKVKSVGVKNTFRRIQLDVILYIILWIPGSILRGSRNSFDPTWLVTLSMFITTFGVWKFFIWVLSDPKVSAFWKGQIKYALVKMHICPHSYLPHASNIKFTTAGVNPLHSGPTTFSSNVPQRSAKTQSQSQAHVEMSAAGLP
jgi:hypothetical protein